MVVRSHRPARRGVRGKALPEESLDQKRDRTPRGIRVSKCEHAVTWRNGVGHVIKQETGTVSGSTYTTVSQLDSVYAPCGCSPMGKLQSVSQPHAPGGTVYWTTYVYL